MLEKNTDFEEAAWFARTHNANRLRQWSQYAAAQDKVKRIAKRVELFCINPRVRTLADWIWCIAVDPCTVRRVFVEIGGSQLDITPFFGQTDHPVARWLSDRVKPHTLDSTESPGNDLMCIPVGIAGIPAGLMPYIWKQHSCSNCNHIKRTQVVCLMCGCTQRTCPTVYQRKTGNPPVYSESSQDPSLRRRAHATCCAPKVGRVSTWPMMFR